MTRAKKVLKKVICCHNPEHVFSVAFAIEPGSEDCPSTVEAYCPQCDKFLSVTVRGEPEVNKVLLRKFKGA